MERAPKSEEYKNPEEELEGDESTEATQEQTSDDTQESVKETDYMRSTRRAAENARNLGISGESFGALSLRNRTVLSLLDVPTDVSSQVGENTESIIFNANGVQYGEAVVDYAPEIQQQIHREFFERRVLSSNFSEQLLDQNEGWRKEIIEAEKKPLIAPAAGVFRDILHSDYIEPKLLARHEGLSNEDFAELVQLETELKPAALTEEFFKQAKIDLPGEKDFEWHAKNAELYQGCTRLVISDEAYKEHLSIMAKKRKEAWAIKATYDIFVEKMAMPAYRPYKSIPRNPYLTTVAYYVTEEEGAPEYRNILGEKIIPRSRRKKFRIDLQKEFHNNPPHPSLEESIDSIIDCCKYQDIPLNLSSIMPTPKSEAGSDNTETPVLENVAGLAREGKKASKYITTPSAIEDFIDNNAIAINKFTYEFNAQYRKSKKDITDFADIVSRKKTFDTDADFIKALRASANFEESLEINNRNAKIIDAINVIYASTSSGYLKRIEFNKERSDEYNRIKNEFDLVTKFSSESGGNLKSASVSREHILEALSEKFNLEGDLDDDIEQIILKNHDRFMDVLKEFLRDEKHSRELSRAVHARSKAEKDFAKKLEDAGLKDEDERLADCEYFRQVSDLSDYLAAFADLSARIRSLECAEHVGDYKHAETLKHAMGFQTSIEAAKKPKMSDIQKRLERITKTYDLDSDIDLEIDYFSKKTERVCELRHKLAVACEADKPRVRPTLHQKRQARLLAEDLDDSPYGLDMAKAWAQDYASGSLFQAKIESIAKSLGYEGLAKDIIFMPGYAVIHNDEAKSTVIPITKEEISESDNETVRLISQYSNKPPFAIPEETEFARQFIAKKIETEVLKNEAAGSGRTERRILQLEDKLGLEFFGGTVDARSGELKKEFTDAELNALETIFPFFGKFIKKIDNTNSYVFDSPDRFVDAISKSHQQFMCNESSRAPSSLFSTAESGGRRLSLTALANILRAKNIPQPKILELIAYDTALYDYGQLSSEELTEFQYAAKDKISTNPTTFMLLYQKLITSPIELRTCATRLAYCREFSKYCANGASSAELKAFFDKRAQKAKQD